MHRQRRRRLRFIGRGGATSWGEVQEKKKQKKKVGGFRRTIELHDISHLPREERFEIERRRQHLATQTGWWLFDVVETSQGRRLIIVGSNKDKRKRAKNLALIAATALDDQSRTPASTTDTHILELVETIRRTWNNRVREVIVRSDWFVEYTDTDGDKIEFRMEGGDMNYYVNDHLTVHHLTKL